MNPTKAFPLLNPLKFGAFNIKNRAGLAALTRMRADPTTGIPNDLHVKYYSERAESAGFILTECSPISVQSEAFPGAAGIYKAEHVEGWKRVTEAVHKVNGRIYLQIWHSGRANRENPVGPSPIPIRSDDQTSSTGYKEGKIPRELTEEDILGIVEDFRKGAKNAFEAGFDGVELHGANGYLIDTFLRDATNKRTDNYGGSIENRSRFPLMVMDALISVFGADRVGVKLTPVGRFQDMFDSDPENLMIYFLGELSNRNVAFVELAKAPEFMPVPNYYGINGEDQLPTIYKTLRPHFNGILVANNGFDWESGNKVLENGEADAVTYGRPFMANPDLIERYSNGWELNQVDFSKAYGGGAEGYIDYPKHL